MIYFQPQVDALLKAKDSHIAVLEAQIKTLNAQIEIERGRAQNAVDQLLSIKGVQPITPQPIISDEVKRTPISPESYDRAMRNMENVLGEFNQEQIDEMIEANK